ncbi:MAG TPA: transporter [Rhodanobacteraceae bacterium]|jgi:hypothetical protein|nr:transporter [Rhodanobacteraceae bacterium]
MIRPHVCSVLVVGALALASMAARAADDSPPGHASVSAGFDYSTGKYGTDVDTRIWDVPFTVGYDTDRWSLKLVVPYIHVSGSNNVIPGAGRVDNGNPIGRGLGRLLGQPGGTPPPTAETSGSASGLGDVVAQATYHLYTNDASRFGVDVGGRIKFATADEDKGLGTGQNDYGVNLDLYKGIGAWTLFGGAGYTDYGSSAFIRLHNGANANVGANYKVGGNDTVGGYYYYREKISDSGYAQDEASLFWNHRFDTAWRLQTYVLTGFSKGSPDWGAGASLKYTF